MSARQSRTLKSATAYRTISEVADELDLAPHVLRFWESKFKQITPVKREGGRRFYRPEDVAMIREIKHLLYTEGFTIKGVQTYLSKGKAETASATQTVLATREILAELKQIRDILS